MWQAVLSWSRSMNLRLNESFFLNIVLKRNCEHLKMFFVASFTTAMLKYWLLRVAWLEVCMEMYVGDGVAHNLTAILLVSQALLAIAAYTNISPEIGTPK